MTMKHYAFNAFFVLVIAAGFTIPAHADDDAEDSSSGSKVANEVSAETESERLSFGYSGQPGDERRYRDKFAVLCNEPQEAEGRCARQ